MYISDALHSFAAPSKLSEISYLNGWVAEGVTSDPHDFAVYIYLTMSKNGLLPGLPTVLLDHGLHGLQLRKVLAHVGMQDHVYNQIAKIAKVSLLHVCENVAVMFLDQPANNKKRQCK